MALVCAARPLEMVGDTPCWQLAFWFIALAAVADFCDGLCARLLDEYSPLGGQLDSLSDMVSFGVAPAMLLFNMMYAAGAPFWACLCALLIPLAGALRLAKFNVDTTQTHSFSGLPIPANAMFCIGLASMLGSEGGVSLYAAVGCMVAIAFLMVAPVRMYSFKLTSWSLKENWLPYSLAVVGVLCVVFMGWTGLFWAIAYYVITSFLSNLFVRSEA